jgi:serine/tyrosine/threonine adenylyltransferase
VEEALAAAVEQADFTVMEKLMEVLSHPFEDLPEGSDYRLPPPPSEKPYRTFCGT